MMVDVDNVRQFMYELDHVTHQLNELSEHVQKGASKQEVKELIATFIKLSTLVGPSLSDKKVVPEEMKFRMEQALIAIQFFRNQPVMTMKKSVDETMVGLFATLYQVIDKFRNSKDLKKYRNRIGRKVEKVYKSKET